MIPKFLPQISNIGLIVFVLIFVGASTFYDGGSKIYPQKKSWDWVHNYWCDLIWPTTILEEPNRTSKWGITANSILCLSMILFFISFARVYSPTNFWLYVTSISGTIAMICAMLIFSKFHDKIIGLILLTVIPAVIGVIYGLIYFERKTAIIWGVIALISIIINVFFWYSKTNERLLPLYQKIAFVVVLSWVYFINTSLTRMLKEH